MKISKEQISNVEKGDTIVLLNRIYDVEENDPSKSILLLKKHGIVNIENLPKDLVADFLIEFEYKGFENKRVNVLEKYSEIDAFISKEHKPDFLRPWLYTGYNVGDEVEIVDDFSKTITKDVFEMDEYALSLQSKEVIISDITYSKKLGVFIFKFKQDEMQRDWFVDVIHDIVDLPF